MAKKVTEEKPESTILITMAKNGLDDIQVHPDQIEQWRKYGYEVVQ